MRFYELIVSFILLFSSSLWSTIYIEDYPDTYEDFNPADADDEDIPSEQSVQRRRPTVQYNATVTEEIEETPKGPKAVPVFGVDP